MELVNGPNHYVTWTVSGKVAEHPRGRNSLMTCNRCIWVLDWIRLLVLEDAGDSMSTRVDHMFFELTKYKTGLVNDLCLVKSMFPPSLSYASWFISWLCKCTRKWHDYQSYLKKLLISEGWQADQPYLQIPRGWLCYTLTIQHVNRRIKEESICLVTGRGRIMQMKEPCKQLKPNLSRNTTSHSPG